MKRMSEKLPDIRVLESEKLRQTVNLSRATMVKNRDKDGKTGEAEWMWLR